jgi:hypothetical protein
MTYTVWQLASAMVINIDHDADQRSGQLYANSFRAAFVMVMNSGVLVHDPAEVSKYLDAYTARGMQRGIWAYLGRDPEGDAALLDQLITETSAHFVVANAEIEYKYTGGDGLQRCTECFDRSDVFIQAFRAKHPKIQLGLSTYGRLDHADLHYAAWLNNGNARVLPQAYPNEKGYSWEVPECFDGAVNVGQPWNPMLDPTSKQVIPGFPARYVHCTIAKPDPNDAYVYTASMYVQQLIAARRLGHPLGFSIYEAENWTLLDLGTMSNGIRTNLLAGVPA